MNVYSYNDIVIRQSGNIIYIDNTSYYHIDNITYTDAIILTKWLGVYYCQEKPISEIIIHGNNSTVTMECTVDFYIRFIGDFKEIAFGKKPTIFVLHSLFQQKTNLFSL